MTTGGSLNFTSSEEGRQPLERVMGRGGVVAHSEFRTIIFFLKGE